MRPVGTFANCAGGVTPWGTILTAEENFDDYFTGAYLPESHEARYRRYGIDTRTWYDWDKSEARFDMTREPNEPHRFGWIVEYDPYDPDSVPVKRTALGRFKHECATTVVNRDGRVVVFSGDDEVFEYVYRFVSDAVYTPGLPEANRDVLDHGTLSVARFADDGTVRWLPLVYGEAGLTPENGFHSQAEVLIYAREAADIVGATPMDRPEDVEVNPVAGALYVVLTKNHEREAPNVANPRAANPYGHILELTPPGIRDELDYAAETWYWDAFLQGGNPENPAHDAMYLAPVSARGWLANPDNVAFDGQGRIWICTDGQESSIGKGEGLYAADCSGAAKGATRLFFTAPRGAEITGPAFTPDSRTLFVSIQHPGEGSSFRDPATRWPDFDPDMPPRPAVVAITHEKGHVLGS
jgi:secreted PhoX family phosphatase